MIGIKASLASTLRAVVGHYNNGERRWAMTTMMAKQQLYIGGGLMTSLAIERALQCGHGGQARQRALTWHFVVLLLLIKVNNYFILFTSLSPLFDLSLSAECFISVCPCPLASAADTSIDRSCPPHPPPPLPNAHACPGLSRKLECVNCGLCPSSTSFALLPLSFALALAASRRQSQAPQL
jgi:hypothetical protein